ncbi:recombinase family protein [Commensalibacter nepenthis]|uniref:Recombinase family protein n=1 Tax=Commensalibacter nepenthis TaxID=3043872 RepID=A0ABT6QAG6_9PROT|nr:recombinase family protein [Commensalibacter sp. TBRC 10068]MDI2113789.1 recombinase family protein [Commensalibacter sp. TBRC 10068]
MFIRAYLRASTKDQHADRAKDMLRQFVEERGHKIASYYIENASGTQLNRIELTRLLNDSQADDILLIEQIDRLTRLNDHDWTQLKKQISNLDLKIVSLDIPTSWQALDKNITDNDPISKAILNAVNNMFIDLMAAISRKDWITRRERQRQGIERGIRNGKYKGKQADLERHQQVISLRKRGLTLKEICQTTDYCYSNVCKILANHKKYIMNKNQDIVFPNKL